MIRFVIFAVLLVVVGGGAFLSTRSIPPQIHPVEKVLPSDKFLK